MTIRDGDLVEFSWHPPGTSPLLYLVIEAHPDWVLIEPYFSVWNDPAEWSPMHHEVKCLTAPPGVLRAITDTIEHRYRIVRKGASK